MHPNSVCGTKRTKLWLPLKVRVGRETDIQSGDSAAMFGKRNR